MQIRSTSEQTIAVPPLRAVRIAQGLTLRQAASAARIDPAHLSKVERGERHLSVESLHRLAGVLELRDLQRLPRPYVDSRTTP
jgi:transcriptional regulator with XRE-family HTH domain